MKAMSFLASLACALLLSSCVTVQNVSLDKASRPPLKSVVLLRVGESQFFQVRDFSGMSALGGIVGGAAQGSIDESRAKQFLQAVNDRNVKFSTLMVGNLKSELQKAGIQAEYREDLAPKLASDGKSDDYSAIKTDKDAILNIWFGATGFVNTAKLSTEFQPWLIVNTRLVDPKTRAIIYQKTFNVGYEAKLNNAVFVALDPKYHFGNFDDLMHRVDFAIEALSSSEQIVASHIAADIR